MGAHIRWRRVWAVLLFFLVLAALWPLRRELTAEAIARRSPRQAVLAAAFLLGLYVLKSVTFCVPMTALTAAGGLLFPLPAALAVNLCGAAAAQTAPFLLGRRRQEEVPQSGGAVPPGAGRAVDIGIFAAAGRRQSRGSGQPPAGCGGGALRHISLRRPSGGGAPGGGGHGAGRRAVEPGQSPVLAVPGRGRRADRAVPGPLASAAQTDRMTLARPLRPWYTGDSH